MVVYRKVLRWWLSKNSCDIFKDFSSTSCIYKLCVLQRVATQYFIKIRTFCNKFFSKCIFLDLRKTSASSRRPVFANPRLRRDLNLRKFDQSTNFYRIWTMFDHVLKALKVLGLVGISCNWGSSEPHTRGQTASEVAENWCPVRFWPKVQPGV